MEEPDFTDGTKELAAKAAKVLGYCGLQRIIPSQGTSAAQAVEVSHVFAELGIEPLSKARVLKYQRWYTRTHGGTFSWERISWESTDIEKYVDPIPEFALSRAVELRERLPKARFKIEFPVRNEIPKSDPFLLMTYGSEEYYLEVWDEPRFEGRRTI